MKGKMVFPECQSANHWAMSSLPMLLSPPYRGPGGSERPTRQNCDVAQIL